MMRVVAALGMAVLLSACASSWIKGEASSRQKLSKTYAEKGAAYLAEGNLEIAASDLRKSLELDPNNAAAHGTIALLYERLRMLDKAAEHYRRAAALKPDDSGIIGNYGRFLCHQGRQQEGLKLLRQAAADKLYAKRWIPLTNAGDCAYAAGRLEEAERYLREALELNPENALALELLVKLMLAKQEYLKARAFLQRYETFAKPTADILKLGYQIESALGDLQAAEAYRNRLNALPPPESSEKPKPSPTE